MKDKKCNYWIAAAVLVFIVLLLETWLVTASIRGFQEYRNNIKQGYNDCGEYCISENQPLLIYDINTGGCQCYTSDHKAAEYKNIKSGKKVNTLRDCQLEDVLLEDGEYWGRMDPKEEQNESYST